jgi:tRNA(Ile)-lysidine synthase
MEHDILNAAYDRLPAIECDGVIIRRHRDLLYCTQPMPLVVQPELVWDPAEPLELPHLGSLVARFESYASKPQSWVVRFREGGESVPARTHHQKLKHLLQEHNVLPWCRGMVPLIYEAEELIAVGDLWVHPNAQFVIRWHDRPDLLARATPD